MAKRRSRVREMLLLCSTGKVVAKTGDRFRDDRTEWEIVAFGAGHDYSPSVLGGTPNVFCKPDALQPIWEKYVEDELSPNLGDGLIGQAAATLG
ncbi:MAG TPA: hypothetical protein VG758_28725 [Hyphomicrobiaceae bacterium]|jgi:hypothetical protein|nr:hypothetical protein [Hyphomicrobiaceae bacterium]